MTLEQDFVKKKLKKLKKRFPETDIEQIEKELYPLQGEEITPQIGKKKKKADSFRQ